MGAFIFTEAAGRIARYAQLPETNDALIAVLLLAAGLEGDATLRDYDDLAALLAASNNEATFTSYARQTLTGVAVTVDDANNRQDVDSNDLAWTSTSAQGLGKIVVCYDPDTTGGTDGSLIPLFADDFVVTSPTAGTLTYAVAAAGFARATAT